MPSVFEVTNLQKKRIKTLEKINLLIPFLLTYLIKNNNFLSTRLTKKIRTIREIFGTIVNKNRVIGKIQLQKLSTLLLKKKKKISFILNVFFIKKKSITPTKVLEKRSEKVSVSFGNLYINDCS